MAEAGIHTGLRHQKVIYKIGLLVVAAPWRDVRGVSVIAVVSIVSVVSVVSVVAIAVPIIAVVTVVTVVGCGLGNSRVCISIPLSLKLMTQGKDCKLWRK